jgi:hypothetical protein
MLRETDDGTTDEKRDELTAACSTAYAKRSKCIDDSFKAQAARHEAEDDLSQARYALRCYDNEPRKGE